MTKQKQTYSLALIKRILGLAFPYRLFFYLSGFLACALAVITPVRPILIQKAVDNHIVHFDFQGLVNICMMMIGVLVLETLIRYFFIYLTSWLGQSVIRDLRTRVFNHIIQMKLRLYDLTPIGSLTTRTINDVEAINQIFSQGIVMIIADVLTIVIVMAYMLIEDWKLALLTMTSIPLMLLGTYIFQKNVRTATKVVREQVSNMNSFLQENISGINIVQLFAKEKDAIHSFDEINKKHRDAHIQTIWYYAIFFPVVELLLAVSVGMIIWWGGQSIIDGASIEMGHILSFILLIHVLFRPMRQLADRFGTLQNGIVAAERVFAVLDQEDQIQDNGKYKADDIKGSIEFKNIDFAYDEENFIIKGLNLEVKSGETIAIVGATGAGKSSIINILTRYYEIQNGEILIDGVNAKEYDLANLRSHIGTVLQDVFLFSGSIMDNITLGNPKIKKEDVYAAAKMVGAHEFIERLPGGYAYDVKERGVSLSIGQRQIISFIRALVFNPEILILDEATSSIDSESEALIQNATEKLVENRTSIIIAHRLSTIQHADKIIVLDKGEVKEMGNHQELIAKDGWYKQLYDVQFKLQEMH